MNYGEGGGRGRRASPETSPAGKDIGVTWPPRAWFTAVKFITRPSETDYRAAPSTKPRYRDTMAPLLRGEERENRSLKLDEVLRGLLRGNAVTRERRFVLHQLSV